MPTFEYARPPTLHDAVSMLASLDGEARPLAGGTDLLVQLRANRLRLRQVVDVKAIPELTRVELDSNGLTIGAAVPCYEIYEHPEIPSSYPSLIDAVSILGGIATQSRATVGGNLCNASPSADTVPALIALAATCSIASSSGLRDVPVEEFCTG